MQPVCLLPVSACWPRLFGLLILFGQVVLSSVQAQPRSSFWRKLHPDSLTSRPLRFVPLPVLQSGPEIGVKGGITLDYFYNAGTGRADKPRFHSRYWQRLDSLNRRTRDSYAFVHVLYSTRRQLAAEGVWNTYGAAERYVMRGRGGYVDFSEDYWGVGNQTLNEREFYVLSYQRWYVQHRFWRRVKGRFFAGLSYYYSNTQNVQLSQGQPLHESLPGSQGSVVSALGPTLLADYRDNPFSPTRGWYAEWAFQMYSHKFGSQFDYTEQSVDLRRYVPLNAKNMVGLQAVGQFTTGTIPLRELPKLGGPTMLRGFVQGRYLDRQLWSAQAEYRRTLNRFLLAAAFAALGGVAEHVTDFSLATTRYAGGVGMRVLLNR
ncbi:MAG: BamA/TamA family outer membrane protein [Spirosoma sp.]|uniref:BamA/TamA family outer membrane protein n=1 Tax=Spirosoma sp. TaxID=1899569 RepID=UPI001ACF4942|nr:BamA/TamA family outer membrane protein [Spirosoma sp.]MBN8827036.1 BamA/TamA family outer membrane protein [Spirosoma sp.]